jgi:hypothetical protein
MTPQPLVKTAAFGKESGHWYQEGGALVEQVLNADGSRYIRPTLRHARVLQLCPGVTSICKTLHAEQLVRWRCNQHMLAALTLPRKDKESEAEWVKRVEKDAGEHARDAAQKGIAIHASIEKSLRGEPYDSEHSEHVDAVQLVLDTHCGTDAKWLPEQGVTHEWGYGTMADCYSEFAGWLVDFKSADFGQEDMKTKTFENHWMQLAATRNCLAPELRCAIVYVSRNNPGLVSFVEVEEAELAKGLGMFRGLLECWQQSKGYKPAWATGAFR